MAEDKSSDIAGRMREHLNSNVSLLMQFKQISDYKIGEITFEETLEALINAAVGNFPVSAGTYKYTSLVNDEDWRMTPCGLLNKKDLNERLRVVNRCLMHVQIYDSKNNKAQYFHVVVKFVRITESVIKMVLFGIDVVPYTKPLV